MKKRTGVTNDAWKRKFIRSLDSCSCFREFSLDKSRERTVHVSPVSCLHSCVAGILAHYDKKELVHACQQYNNTHLIEFWKWFCTWQDKAADLDATVADFPLFEVKRNFASGESTLVPVGVERFETLFFWQTVEDNDSYRFCKSQVREEFRPAWSDTKHDPLIQLLGRLTMLKLTYIKSTTFLYNRFLAEQHQKSSPSWDAYKIHYFLDSVLYKYPDGRSYSAVFDKIFFNNNLLEIKIFLRHCLESRVCFTLEDVAAFLERQRTYYVQLALHIGLEQNAFLNNRRDLMYFDPQRGIAVMPELGRHMLVRLREELVDKAGMVQMDGCPFAKSKGLSKNAAAEVYARFDQLMLKLVERWLFADRDDGNAAVSGNHTAKS